MRIACPHCQVAIEVVDTAPESELTCPSCGSRVERTLATTLIVSPEEAAELDRINEELKQAESTQAPKPENTESVPPSPPKRMFGRYELLSLLGRGAFGEVWKAFDTIDRRHVALKLLRSQSEVKPGDEEAARDARLRFEREARTLAKLDHPGVVRLYKFGEIDGRLYLASELIEGLNLQMLVKRMRADEHSLTHKEAAQLCGQVAEALHAAHQAGIVHRDLKPANILMDTNGLPHVADFGLAKREDRAEYTLTQDQTVLGTPEYMSPEQWRDSHKVGPASDIYSLGVILYELLTGRVPFPCTTDKWILLRDLVLKEEPIAPRRLSLAIPIGLESICLKCLEKDPAQRFATAADLCQELNRFVRGNPIVTPPITRFHRAWRWCQHKPVMAALTAAVVISMLAGTIVSTIFGLDANEKRLLADKKTIAASEAEKRKSEALREVTTQKSEVQRTLARRMVGHAVQEFQADRLENGRHELLQALGMTDDDDPLRDSIHRLLSGWTMRREIMVHPAEIRTMAVSPDGRHLAVTSGDSNVWLWNLETKTLVTDPLQHNGEVTSLAFSHDGALLLTGSTDRTARLWNVASRMPQTVSFPHREKVTAVAFAPDDSWFAVGTADSLVWIWDRQREQLKAAPLGEFPTDNLIRTIAVSANGDLLAAADSYGSASIWNVRDSKEQHRVRHEKFITSMTFSPDGRFLIAGSDDNSVRFWNVASGKNDRTLKHDYQVTSLAMIRGGETLLTGTWDRKVRLWDLKEMPQPAEILGQAFLPTRLEGSGNGGDEEPIRPSFPPTFSQPATPRVVEQAEVNSPDFEREWILDSSVVHVAECSKTGDILMATKSGIILCGHGIAMNGRDMPKQHLLNAGSFACDEKAARIIKESDSRRPDLHGIWRLADAESSRTETVTKFVKEEVRTAGMYKSFSLGDSAAEKPQIVDVQYLMNQNFFDQAINLDDLSAIVFDVERAELSSWDLRTNKQSSGSLKCPAKVQFVIRDSGGKRVYLSFVDGTVRVWTPANGLNLEIQRRLSSEIIDLALSEDGQTLVSVTVDGRIETWRTDRFEPRVLKIRTPFLPTKVAARRDGEMVAIGGDDGRLAIISLSNLEIREIEGLNGQVTHLVFDSSGTHLAATSDSEIMVVSSDERPDLKTLSRWTSESAIVAARFISKATNKPPLLMTVSRRGSISEWDCSESNPKHRTIREGDSGDQTIGMDGAAISEAGQQLVLFWSSAHQRLRPVHETISLDWELISLSRNRMPVITDRGLLLGGTLSNGLQTWRVAPQEIISTESPLASSLGTSPELECLRTSVNGRRFVVAFHPRAIPSVHHRLPDQSAKFLPVNLFLEPDEPNQASRCLVFDTSNFEKPVSLHSERPLRLARFGADERLLLTADVTGGITIWNLDRFEEQKQCRIVLPQVPKLETPFQSRRTGQIPTPSPNPIADTGLTAPVIHDAAIAPNGKWFVLGCSDNVARVHSTEDGQERFPPLKHDDQVAAVAISPNGEIIASASIDDSVGIWNANTGERIASLPHRDDVVAVSFSPNGSVLLTGSSDMTAQFWDTKTWKPRGNPLMHGNTVTSVAFSPNGKLALTSSWDRTVRLWDVVTGLPICEPMPHELPVEQASFFTDGTAILANCSHGLSRVWRVPTPETRDSDALKLQVEVETGMIADPNGNLRRLTHAEWQQRSRDSLSGLGKKN